MKFQAAQLLAAPVTLKVDFDGLVALVTEGADAAKPTQVTAMAVSASTDPDRQRLPKMAKNFTFQPPFHYAYLKIQTKNLLPAGQQPALGVVDGADTLIELNHDDISIPALQGSGVVMTGSNLDLVPHVQDIAGVHGIVSKDCFGKTAFAQQRIAARLAFTTGSLATMGPLRDDLCPTQTALFNYASLKAKVGSPGAEVDLSAAPGKQLYGETELTASVPQGFVDVTLTSYAATPGPTRQLRLSPAPGETEIDLTLLDLPAALVLGKPFDGSHDAAWLAHFLWFYTLTDATPDILPVPHLTSPPCGGGNPYCSGGFMVHKPTGTP
ncbi:MAG TPA: hypothetical protein VKY89_12765 [Thermoanaerobaculia bacterium]|nr:hypothetical protein [Thermoanaerobaculia bacterium]